MVWPPFCSGLCRERSNQLAGTGLAGPGCVANASTGVVCRQASPVARVGVGDGSTLYAKEPDQTRRAARTPGQRRARPTGGRADATTRRPPRWFSRSPGRRREVSLPDRVNPPCGDVRSPRRGCAVRYAVPPRGRILGLQRAGWWTKRTTQQRADAGPSPKGTFRTDMQALSASTPAADGPAIAESHMGRRPTGRRRLSFPACCAWSHCCGCGYNIGPPTGLAYLSTPLRALPHCPRNRRPHD